MRVPLLLLGLLSFSHVSMAQDVLPATAVSNETATPSAIRSKLTQIKHNVSEKLHDFSEKPSIKKLKVDAKAGQPTEIKDPFEKFNRKIFAVNNFVDQHAVKPLALQYQRIFPEQIRGGYTHFRTNLREPWSATNQLLQGRPKVASKTVGRFLINTLTTFGLADVAKRKKLELERDDFGNTLAVWGVPSGPYIMLPAFGPSTLRDSFGQGVDSFISLNRNIFPDDKSYWTNQAIDVLNTRSQLFAAESLLQGDRYIALRDAYLQQRSYTVATKRGEEFNEQLFSEDTDQTVIDDAEIPLDDLPIENPIEPSDSNPTPSE